MQPTVGLTSECKFLSDAIHVLKTSSVDITLEELYLFADSSTHGIFWECRVDSGREHLDSDPLASSELSVVRRGQWRYIKLEVDGISNSESLVNNMPRAINFEMPLMSVCSLLPTPRSSSFPLVVWPKNREKGDGGGYSDIFAVFSILAKAPTRDIFI